MRADVQFTQGAETSFTSTVTGGERPTTHKEEDKQEHACVCVIPGHLLNVEDKTDSVDSLLSAVMDDLPEEPVSVCSEGHACIIYCIQKVKSVCVEDAV